LPPSCRCRNLDNRHFLAQLVGRFAHLGAALLLTLPLLALAGDRLPSARTTGHIDLRPLVLWAWDRDDDLRFLDLRDTGIAHLAATLTLRGDAVDLAARLLGSVAATEPTL